MALLVSNRSCGVRVILLGNLHPNQVYTISVSCLTVPFPPTSSFHYSYDGKPFFRFPVCFFMASGDSSCFVSSSGSWDRTEGGSAPLPSVQTLVLSLCEPGHSQAAAESLWFWTLNTSPPVLLLISEDFENVWVAKSMGKLLSPWAVSWWRAAAIHWWKHRASAAGLQSRWSVSVGHNQSCGSSVAAKCQYVTPDSFP